MYGKILSSKLKEVAMNVSSIDAIQKINLSVANESASVQADLRILWLNAFSYDNKDSLNFRPHNHTFFEVHFVTQGHIKYRFDNSEANISAGNYLLIPPHCIHCIVDQTYDFQKITLAFEVEEASDLYLSLSDLANHTCPTDEEIGLSIDFINRIASQKLPYIDSIMKSRLSEMVYLIAANSPHRPINGNIGVILDPRLLKAKKYVEDNPHIFLSCDEVAQYCRLSPKQLGRLFQQYEGCSLLSFIHGQKIEAAKKLIRETDELFESISEKLGFSSVNYFGKFFTRCTGITPGEYRKSISSK